MEQIQIVVGVLSKNNEVLIALRQKHQTYANYWEFPGGKVEENESVEDALIREFKEEIGIKTSNWQPLIQIPWLYKHANVVLNVFSTSEFIGKETGKEGQKIQWVKQSQLHKYKFPKANKAIELALTLPNCYAITGSFKNKKDGLNKLQKTLNMGVKLIQLRAKHLDEASFIDFAIAAIELTHKHKAKILLNGDVDLLKKLPQADGLQLSFSAIVQLTQRPIATNKLLGVSTHNQAEITKALELSADIILISPVNKTATHPDLNAIGWQKFKELVQEVNVPAYALGGMNMADIALAQKHGGQGIAAISCFW